MLIKKIKLKNFRQFLQPTEIEFSSGSENVSIIIADNGTGKTTLSQAFLWCLYGETTFKNQKLINNKAEFALAEGGIDAVMVALDIEQNGVPYTIKRQEYYTKKNGKVRLDNDKTEFRISYKDPEGKTKFMTKGEATVFINKLLPKELSSFFFFGGEKIESMSKDIIEDGKSDEFKDAVNGLAGLTAILNILQHFRLTKQSSVYGQFKNDLDDEGNTSLTTYIQKIQECTFEIETGREEIKKFDNQLDAYNNKISEKNRRLGQLLEAERIEEELKNTREKISSDKIIKNDNINSFLSMFSRNTKNILSTALINTAINDLEGTGNLEKGIPDMRDTTIKFLIERGFCICGTKLEVGSEAYRKVLDLIDVLPPKNLGQLIGEFSTLAKERVKNNDEFMDNFHTAFKNIRRIDRDIEQLRYKENDLLAQVTNEGEGKTLRSEIAEYENMVNGLNYKKAQLKAEIKDKESERSRLESQKSAMNQISKKNEKILEYMEYAKHVYSYFESEYEIRSKTVREDLEKRINEFLLEIFKGSITIGLDSKYKIKTIITDGDIIGDNNEEMDESTAQGYAVIFAFISALIEMAKEKAKEDIQNFHDYTETGIDVSDAGFQDSYPLVMDAPLSVFDKTRIKHICEILPTIADQVVFFIKDTDGEIAEQYLKEKIGAKYCLNRHNLEAATTVERIL